MQTWKERIIGWHRAGVDGFRERWARHRGVDKRAEWTVTIVWALGLLPASIAIDSFLVMLGVGAAWMFATEAWRDAWIARRAKERRPRMMGLDLSSTPDRVVMSAKLHGRVIGRTSSVEWPDMIVRRRPGRYDHLIELGDRHPEPEDDPRPYDRRTPHMLWEEFKIGYGPEVYGALPLEVKSHVRGSRYPYLALVPIERTVVFSIQYDHARGRVVVAEIRHEGEAIARSIVMERCPL